MLLSEIFDQLQHTETNISPHYINSTNINNLNVKVDIEQIDDNVAIVDFFVNNSQLITGDTNIQDTIKIFQFVISCINNYNNQFPNIEFCFGADEEHVAIYDKLLPKLASKYNMFYRKYPLENSRISNIKNWIFSKMKKHNNTIKIVCLYYIKKNQRRKTT